MSKRQRTISNNSKQQTTLLGLWKESSNNSNKSNKKVREDTYSNTSLSSESNNNAFLSTKQPKWRNISLHCNAPMCILHGGIGGKKKASIRKSLIELPDWNENVTFQAFGKQCVMRRRICQYSLQGKYTYSYSGLKNVEAPAFPSNLYEIKCKVEDLMMEYILSNLEMSKNNFSLPSEFIDIVKESAARKKSNERVDIFNYCLLNHYRNGEEYMSYHADDEQSLCPFSPIASVSFGVTRNFDVRQKMTSGNRNEKRSRLARIPLGDGDVLLMFPPMQQHYEHSLPVEKRVVGERVNLTFRRLR